MVLGDVGAPGCALSRASAGAPIALMQREKPRAEVNRCAVRQLGGYGSLPLASTDPPGPYPGRCVVDVGVAVCSLLAAHSAARLRLKRYRPALRGVAWERKVF